MHAEIFLYMFARIMKESVHAEQFLYAKHALQYVNGHADYQCRTQGFPKAFFNRSTLVHVLHMVHKFGAEMGLI